MQEVADCWMLGFRMLGFRRFTKVCFDIGPVNCEKKYESHHDTMLEFHV